MTKVVMPRVCQIIKSVKTGHNDKVRAQRLLYRPHPFPPVPLLFKAMAVRAINLLNGQRTHNGRTQQHPHGQQQKNHVKQAINKCVCHRVCVYIILFMSSVLNCVFKQTKLIAQPGQSILIKVEVAAEVLELKCDILLGVHPKHISITIQRSKMQCNFTK